MGKVRTVNMENTDNDSDTNSESYAFQVRSNGSNNDNCDTYSVLSKSTEPKITNMSG